jgi:hypothetical protein
MRLETKRASESCPPVMMPTSEMRTSSANGVEQRFKKGAWTAGGSHKLRRDAKAQQNSGDYDGNQSKQVAETNASQKHIY